MFLTVMSFFQVIEVGVTDVRYVALEHARPWVIHAYRNIKGRGLHQEEELESETIPIPPTVTAVTSVNVDANATKASSGDVIRLEPIGSTDDTFEHSTGIDDDNSKKRKREEKDEEGDADPSENSGEPGNVPKKIRVDDVAKGQTEDALVAEETSINKRTSEVVETSAAKKLKIDDDTEGRVEIERLGENKRASGEVETTAPDVEPSVATTGAASECLDGDDIRTRSTRKRKSTEKETQTSTTVPPPTSTYDKVRLIIQPWRKPEGGVNKPILKMMLESVMLFLMMKPGSTEKSLHDRYLPYLQPMVLWTVVKILEEIGCLTKKHIRQGKCSLFSKPLLPELSSVDTEHHDTMYFPTEECMFRLGQFGREFYPNVKWPATTR